MAVILLSMSPEPGHVCPTFKVALDLKARGHRVIYHTMSQFHATLRSLGFECVPYLSKMVTGGSKAAALYASDLPASEMFSGVMAEHKITYPELFNIIENEIRTISKENSVNLVLADGGMCIAGLDPTDSNQLDFQTIDLYPILPWMGWEQTTRFKKRSSRSVFLCPSEFELPHVAKNSGFYAEGSLYFGAAEDGFSWSWIDPDRPLVYCTFGTQCKGYLNLIEVQRCILAAARDLDDCQFVLTAGPFYEQLSREPIPSNIMVVPRAPQPKLLECASIVLTHGGLGTIKEAIYFGVPMLIIPYRYDQPGNAIRVCHHGLGTTCFPHDLTTEILVGEIRNLLEAKEILARVTAFQTTFREREKEQVMSGLCEKFLQM